MTNTTSLVERIQERFLAVRYLDLSDQKVLRTVLEPLVSEFDNLPTEEKTKLFIILTEGFLTWIDQLARHPQVLTVANTKPRYVT